MRSRRCLVLLPLLLLAGACGDGDEPDAAASSTTSTAAPTSSTTTAEAGPELGPPVDLGQGPVLGVHPREPLAYVAETVPGEVGCEGGDLTELAVQPVDGGPRADAGPDLPAGTIVPGGAGGRVLIVDQCEGFLTAARTASPGAGGGLTDVQTEELRPSVAERLVRPGTIRWSGDGRSVIALEQDEVLQVAAAVRFRPGAPAEVLVADPTLVAVAELAGGRLVTATERSVTVADEAPVPVTFFSLEVDPGGRRVGVFGEEGVLVLEPGRPPVQVDDRAASVGSWSPDGRSLAYLRLVGDGAAAWLTPLGRRPVEVAPAAGFSAPRFTADGGTLVFDTAVDSGEGYDEPRATSRRIRA